MTMTGIKSGLKGEKFHGTVRSTRRKKGVSRGLSCIARSILKEEILDFENFFLDYSPELKVCFRMRKKSYHHDQNMPFVLDLVVLRDEEPVSLHPLHVSLY